MQFNLSCMHNTFQILRKQAVKVKRETSKLLLASLENKSHITVSDRISCGREQESQCKLHDSLSKRQSWTQEK